MQTVLPSLLLLVATAAYSEDRAVMPETPPAAEAKKICRSEQQVGSMMTKRTCHTAADWAAIDKFNRDTVDRVRERAGTSSPRS